MKNWLTVGRYLFKEYIVYNLIFTIFCINAIIKYDTGAFLYIPLFKIAGYIFTAMIYYWRRKKYIYFFYNLGFNFKHLVLYSLVFDIGLTTIILIIINLIFN